jgi:hypothetical protein
MQAAHRNEPFENPTSPWKLSGSFIIEVEPDVRRLYEVFADTKSKNIVKIENGHAESAMDGVHFFADPKKKRHFYYRFQHLVSIKNVDGSLYWINYRYQGPYIRRT